MGQILHGSAKTTHAVRSELQRSQASVANLARQYGINEKTVLKWRRRQSVEDMPMAPKERRSTMLLKGLKAELALILDGNNMSACNAYIPLNRGAKRIAVISQDSIIGHRL